MSILHSSQALTGSASERQDFLKSLLLSWIEETQPQLRSQAAQLRRELNLSSMPAPLPYEVVIVPPGMGLVGALKRALQEVGEALGVGFDFREAQDIPGQEQVSALLRHSFPERIGSGPIIPVALLESALPPDSALEAAQTFPGFLLRRYQRASAQAFGEAAALEQMREEGQALTHLQQAARDSRYSQAASFAAGPEVAAALRVIGMEIGKTSSEHPVVTLAQQDAALGALYIVARAQQLRDNPPQAPSPLTNGASPELLEATLYHEGSSVMGPLMAARVLRRTSGLVEELEQSGGKLSILLERAEQSTGFSCEDHSPQGVLRKLTQRLDLGKKAKLA